MGKNSTGKRLSGREVGWGKRKRWGKMYRKEAEWGERWGTERGGVGKKVRWVGEQGRERVGEENGKGDAKKGREVNEKRWENVSLGKRVPLHT